MPKTVKSTGFGVVYDGKKGEYFAAAKGKPRKLDVKRVRSYLSADRRLVVEATPTAARSCRLVLLGRE